MFGKNWKTTVAGLVFAAAGITAQLGNGNVKEVATIITTAAASLGLLAAKDAPKPPTDFITK